MRILTAFICLAPATAWASSSLDEPRKIGFGSVSVVQTFAKGSTEEFVRVVIDSERFRLALADVLLSSNTDERITKAVVQADTFASRVKVPKRWSAIHGKLGTLHPAQVESKEGAIWLEFVNLKPTDTFALEFDMKALLIEVGGLVDLQETALATLRGNAPERLISAFKRGEEWVEKTYGMSARRSFNLNTSLLAEKKPTVRLQRETVNNVEQYKLNKDGKYVSEEAESALIGIKYVEERVPFNDLLKGFFKNPSAKFDAVLDLTTNALDQRSKIDIGISGVGSMISLGDSVHYGAFRIVTSQNLKTTDLKYETALRYGDWRGGKADPTKFKLAGEEFEAAIEVGFETGHTIRKALRHVEHTAGPGTARPSNFFFRPLARLRLAKFPLGSSKLWSVTGTVTVWYMMDRYGGATDSVRWAEHLTGSLNYKVSNDHVLGFELGAGRNTGQQFVKVGPTYKLTYTVKF